MVIDLWVSSSVGKRNAQEGTKTHRIQLHSRVLLSCVLETETHWFSTWHGTVAARIWLDIVYTGR